MTLEWLEDESKKPDLGLGLLGDLPRGFLYAGSGIKCDDTSPAYVRGFLLPTKDYNALGVDGRLALRNPNVYPRWRLYGGPFSLRYVAQEWDDYLNFWGFDKGLTWVSHGVVCLVPESVLAWPSDKSLRWDWVYETGYPKAASRHYDAQKGQYVVTYGTVAAPPSSQG